MPKRAPKKLNFMEEITTLISSGVEEISKLTKGTSKTLPQQHKEIQETLDLKKRKRK